MEKNGTASELSTSSNESLLTSVLCTDFAHYDTKLLWRNLIGDIPEDDATHFKSSERADSGAAERESQDNSAVRATPSVADLVVEPEKGMEKRDGIERQCWGLH